MPEQPADRFLLGIEDSKYVLFSLDRLDAVNQSVLGIEDSQYVVVSSDRLDADCVPLFDFALLLSLDINGLAVRDGLGQELKDQGAFMVHLEVDAFLSDTSIADDPDGIVEGLFRIRPERIADRDSTLDQRIERQP